MIYVCMCVTKIIFFCSPNFLLLMTVSNFIKYLHPIIQSLDCHQKVEQDVQRRCGSITSPRVDAMKSWARALGCPENCEGSCCHGALFHEYVYTKWGLDDPNLVNISQMKNPNNILTNLPQFSTTMCQNAWGPKAHATLVVYPTIGSISDFPAVPFGGICYIVPWRLIS